MIRTVQQPDTKLSGFLLDQDLAVKMHDLGVMIGRCAQHLGKTIQALAMPRRTCLTICAALLSGALSTYAQGQRSLKNAFVVMVDEEGALQQVSLNNGHKTTLSASKRTDGISICAIGGPSTRGLVAYVEDHRPDDGKEQHILKAVAVNGTPRILWTRNGSCRSESLLGQHIASSNEASRLAYLIRLDGRQEKDAYYQEGCIELYDIDTNTLTTTSIRAIDDNLSWCRGNLYFTALVDSHLVKDTAPNHVDWYIGSTIVPVICRLDPASCTVTRVHIGEFPLASPNGAFILFCARRSVQSYPRWLLLDTRAGTVSAVTLPCSGRYVCGLLSDRTAVLFSPQESTKWTRYYSPIRGPQRLQSISVGMLNQHECRSLLVDVDPRAEISVGVVTQ